MKFHRLWNAVLFAMLCAVVAPTVVAAATYRMTLKSTPETGGKCVSVLNGPFVEGMPVFLWDCNAALAQTLFYDDQTQELKFGANCVEVLGQGNVRDAIGVGKCDGSDHQRWNMIANNDYYQIVGTSSFCLDISNGTANGTPLDLSECTPNSVVQLWTRLQESEASAAQSVPAQPVPAQPVPAQPVPAQPSNAVQNILKRHGLMGTFAEDCTKDPSDNNQYIVHRVLDTERVERDQMKSRGARSYAAVVDNAEELTPNDVAISILITETTIADMKDWRLRLVTRIDGNRIRLMESGALSGPYAGRTNIFAGRAANGGDETRWLTKCQ